MGKKIPVKPVTMETCIDIEGCSLEAWELLSLPDAIIAFLFRAFTITEPAKDSPVANRIRQPALPGSSKPSIFPRAGFASTGRDPRMPRPRMLREIQQHLTTTIFNQYEHKEYTNPQQRPSSKSFLPSRTFGIAYNRPCVRGLWYSFCVA